MILLWFQILELRGACMDYGAMRVLDNFSYTFVKGDRVGVVGRNGVGKSTVRPALLLLALGAL